MKNILVVAFQLHHSAGSECSVAMDFARNMSRYHHITMLYGAGRQFHKIGDTAEMEEWTKSHNIMNADFIPVYPSFKSREYGYSMLDNFFFYREYRRWHRDLRRKIEELCAFERYDLIHYLGPIGYHEPGFLRGLGVPVIWGPIGGFESVSIGLLNPFISFQYYFKTIVKNIVNVFQYRFDRRVRAALSESDAVIFAISKYIDIVSPFVSADSRRHFYYLPENCIANAFPLNESKFSGNLINMIFIGRLDYHKGFYFIIEALKKIKDRSRIRLHVLGAGPLEEKFKLLSNEVSDSIIWHGSVPRGEVIFFLNNSHIMVLPSILDANTTVVWEAMSVGVPILAFDHCGFHDTIIDRKTGFLVHPTTYSKAVKDIADIINEIIDNPQILKEYAMNVLSHRNIYTWENRAAFLNHLYDSITENAKQ